MSGIQGIAAAGQPVAEANISSSHSSHKKLTEFLLSRVECRSSITKPSRWAARETEKNTWTYRADLVKPNGSFKEHI